MYGLHVAAVLPSPYSDALTLPLRLLVTRARSLQFTVKVTNWPSCGHFRERSTAAKVLSHCPLTTDHTAVPALDLEINLAALLATSFLVRLHVPTFKEAVLSARLCVLNFGSRSEQLPADMLSLLQKPASSRPTWGLIMREACRQALGSMTLITCCQYAAGKCAPVGTACDFGSQAAMHQGTASCWGKTTVVAGSARTAPRGTCKRWHLRCR